MKANWIKSLIVAAALAATGAGGQAWAARVTGGLAPIVTAARKVPAPGEKAAADDSTSMREGVITGVSAKRDQIEVNGSWLKVADGTTRVFRQGRAVGREKLKKGQNVRFTLAPGSAGRTVLGAVYVP